MGASPDEVRKLLRQSRRIIEKRFKTIEQSRRIIEKEFEQSRRDIEKTLETLEIICGQAPSIKPCRKRRAKAPSVPLPPEEEEEDNEDEVDVTNDAGRRTATSSGLADDNNNNDKDTNVGGGGGGEVGGGEEEGDPDDKNGAGGDGARKLTNFKDVDSMSDAEGGGGNLAYASSTMTMVEVHRKTSNSVSSERPVTVSFTCFFFAMFCSPRNSIANSITK